MEPRHAELSQEKLRSAIQSVIFTKHRNREIDASMEAYARQRELAFTAARNREIEVSMARSAAFRNELFVAQRNAEINLAMAASDRLRMTEFSRPVTRKSTSPWPSIRPCGLLFAEARNKEIQVASAAQPKLAASPTSRPPAMPKSRLPRPPRPRAASTSPVAVWQHAARDGKPASGLPGNQDPEALNFSPSAHDNQQGRPHWAGPVLSGALLFCIAGRPAPLFCNASDVYSPRRGLSGERPCPLTGVDLLPCP